MKGFRITWAKTPPKHGPLEWNAYGENEADALERWEHCFGEGFKIVTKGGKPVPATT